MARVTCCATIGYAAHSLETALARIARRGFRRVEITELGSYCRHFPLKEPGTPRIGEHLKHFNLRAVAMNVSASRMVEGRIYRPRLSDFREGEEIVRCASWFLEQAARLGIRILSFPIGPRVSDSDWRSETEASIGAFRRIADAAQEAGVSLNLEAPHLFQLTDSIAHAMRVFDALDHLAVGATVDSSHWGVIRYDLDSYFSFLGPRLRHVHLRDSAGADTADFNQDLERTPGRGTVDFRAFGEALDRADYRGEVSLELEHRHGDLAVIEREFDFALAHLKSCGWEVDLA